MKKIAIYIILLLPIMVMAQKGTYTVKGRLGVKEGLTTAKLACFSPSIKETQEIKDGAFEFKGTIDEPVKVMLTVVRNVAGKTRNEIYWFYLEPGVISLESATDSIAHAKIIGSKLNEEFKMLQASLNPLEKRKNALSARYKKLTDDERGNETLMSGFDKANNTVQEEMDKVYLNFLLSHKDSFLSLEAYNKVAGKIPEYSTAAPLFEQLSSRIKATPTGQKYAAQLESLKNTAVGTMSIDFTQPDLQGKAVKLSDYKGKYVLVDFWASWCGPCRAENPNVLKAYKNYNAKGLEILGVSLDIEYFKKNWLHAIEADKLPWKQVSDLKEDNAVAKIYGITAIPQNILVDPKGKIVAKNLKGEDLHKKLAEIFDKKS